MTIVVYEDAACDRLAPITTGRLAFTIRCGGTRLLDVLSRFDQPILACHRPYLDPIRRHDYPSVAGAFDSEVNSSHRPELLINARVVPDIRRLLHLRSMMDNVSRDQPTVLWDRDHVAAVLYPSWTIKEIAERVAAGAGSLVDELKIAQRRDDELATFDAPHEVIQRHMEIFNSNLEVMISDGPYTQLQDGLFVSSQVRIGEHVVVDASKGPIVLEAGVDVGPYTLLRGPILVEPNGRILEHAAIKDAVALGHTTKIGGEVEASIVEPYSNKQHHGFLGHSYLGSWINLGAGTCNSDLKNTYGSVSMDYSFGKSSTGMQFLGCIMGDYCKSAINTGIFTGKVIGVCSMMYGFVTSNVPSFVNYARLFGQIATLPPDVMIATQQRMFARRKVEQRPCDIELIQEMFRMTQDERDRFGDALAF